MERDVTRGKDGRLCFRGSLRADHCVHHAVYASTEYLRVSLDQIFLGAETTLGQTLTCPGSETLWSGGWSARSGRVVFDPSGLTGLRPSSSEPCGIWNPVLEIRTQGLLGREPFVSTLWNGLLPSRCRARSSEPNRNHNLKQSLYA